MAGTQLMSGPVFIVGLARSGTTLMAVCLDRHPAFDCGPETHLLTALATPDGRRVLEPAGWPDRATDLVCSIVREDVLVHEAAGVSRERVRASLAARPPSVRAVLESLTVPQAADAGAPRWVEKTPRHLDHLATIRREWPDATIIRMVRDPRARAVSAADMPFGAPSQVGALLDGARREARARSAVAADPRLLTVRLEDLVADPARELGRVCESLGEPFDEWMLDTTEPAAAVVGEVAWKARAGGPIEADAADAWRSRMDPGVARLAALYCARELDRDGYPGARRRRGTVMMVPAGRRVARVRESPLMARVQESLLIDLAAADLVVAPTASLRRSDLRRAEAVAWLAPDGWLLPRRGPTGWRVAAIVALDLLGRRLRRRPALRIVLPDGDLPDGRPTGGRRARGLPARLMARCIRVLARPISLDQAPAAIAVSAGVRSAGRSSAEPVAGVDGSR